MKANILCLPGDGIGPEIMESAVKVIEIIQDKYGHEFTVTNALLGGIAIDAYNNPLPAATLDACQSADAVLLGAVGGPKWDAIDPKLRPEQGLLRLRKTLGLYANLRPATVIPALVDASPLKNEIVNAGVDLLVVRELIGGIYFGEKSTDVIDGVRTAYDTERYDENEIRRIAKTAFDTAMLRDKKVTLVDKANVLDSSKLWRAVVSEMSADYPDVKLSYMYVDNCAMQLVRNPAQFDVILTNNIFGDILSDEASMITGSIGMLPSASLGEGGVHLYEPIHGSAPDIAGKDIANPCGTILSVAMMLRYSFGLEKEAQTIESAVHVALAEGARTADLAREGEPVLSGSEMCQRICDAIASA